MILLHSILAEWVDVCICENLLQNGLYSFFFLKTDFFSHTIYLDHNFPCLCYYTPPLTPSSILPLSPFKKQQTSKRQQPKTTKQNTVKQGKNSSY